ncbi:MAG: DUF885 family protein [Anaerolineae bacterium]|nr:DUF885 family protein [Anaerolineae bacterium]
MLRMVSRLWVIGVLFGILCGACTVVELDRPSETTIMPADVSQTLTSTPFPAMVAPTPTPAVVSEDIGVHTPVTDALPASVAYLQGVDIETFFEQSYYLLLRRNPEAVTALGIGGKLGLGNDQLTDISDTYIRETQALESAILALLETYPYESLTPEQQCSVDVYRWYLQDRIQQHEFMYNDYPLNPIIIGFHNDLIHFFTQIHPLTTHREAEDYIARLGAVEGKVAQLLDGLQRREEAGVMLPQFVIQWILRDISGIAQSSARTTPFYTAFQEKVEGLEGLDGVEKQKLLTGAEAQIEASVLPAFGAIADVLRRQQQIATDDAGVWKFPNGEAYYAYTLRHHTTTNMSAGEIHELGKQEMTRIQDEMRARFAALGYPASAGLPELFDRVAKEGGSVYGDQIVAEYEMIIEAAERDVAEVFDLRPAAEVIVIGGESGGYYVSPAVDGSRPGAFYARAVGSETKFSMPTLAYHEAVPGHHLQIAIAQELDLPFFRNDMGFTGYVEGWALYAEQLAWELGFYEDDVYGDLGRLQAEAFRAARLVVDTGIHAKRWTYNQAVDYMVENTGLSQGMVEYEVARYVCWPGQAVAYKVGMLKILELRQRAMDALGERFDLKEFHNIVLGNGSVPLEILEDLVDAYIERALTAASSDVVLPVGDGVVAGWAVLAEKDDYADVDMTPLPTDYINIVRLRQVMLDAGWQEDRIRDLREFDRADLREGLEWLAKNADADDRVFFYVAAHGSYLRDVVEWETFFVEDWATVLSPQRVLMVDACQAELVTADVCMRDSEGATQPCIAIAAVNEKEYAWAGLEEEGLPIIGGVFTYYFAAAFATPGADSNQDNRISVQEAAIWAEAQQRTYMHEVVFEVPEFVEMYPQVNGRYPADDPNFPHVVIDDTLGEPVYLELSMDG